MIHASEVLRIIRHGISGNTKGVRSYAELLAEKLDADGEKEQAARIWQLLSGEKQQVVTIAEPREEPMPESVRSCFPWGEE